MNSINNVIQSAINNALMQTHTGFFAKVLSVEGWNAKIQPLNMVKAVGGKAQKQPAIIKVPILKPTYFVDRVWCNHSSEHGSCNVQWTYETIKAGDTVYCVCAERDITETRKGKFALPVKGRHQLSDAVIVGKVGD